jgi:hypothetical protein
MGHAILQNLVRGNDFGIVDVIVISSNRDSDIRSSLCFVSGAVGQRRQVTDEVGYDVSGKQACG